MSERYFVESPIGAAASVRLTGPEAQHLVRVMRAQPGEQVILFDGSGWEFTARIERLERGEAELAIVEARCVDRELPVPISALVSLPKGDRQRWLVEKCVELGVAALTPLIAARSVVRPEPSSLERLRRYVVEASKQCGRNRLMAISEPRTMRECLAEAAPGFSIMAHPAATESLAAVAARYRRPADSVRFAVGPEGGFTAEEVELACSANWPLVNLGPRTLRTETAVLALVCAAAHA